MMHREFRLGAVLAAGVLLAGCAQDTAYRIASFLFDGVPAPAVSAEHPPGSAIEDGDRDADARDRPDTSSSEGRQEVPSVAEAAAALTVHAPYAGGACSSCHDPDNSFRLLREGSELCAGCHTRVLTGKAVVHLPAAADCLICHAPHNSPQPRLLLQPVELLCMQCHEREGLEEVHGEIADCRSCHNPHESDEASLLDFK
jgi:predicted CXXCH cytochrome family protein